MEEKIVNLLPKDFLDRMKTMLQEDYDAFVKSYDLENFTSLRLNTLKVDESFLEKLTEYNLKPVPWCPTGYYYDNRAGKSEFHEIGAYYIQEASAMSVVEAIGIEEGDYVLDLCAAPGGKSTHIACKLNGTGLLVSNEIVPNRAKILSSNIERMGIKNALVINHSPDQIENKFENLFDKIIVDAPCSGEGMFRKNIEAIKEWNLESVEMCAVRQLNILESAYKMLKPNGKMVYSTCTFSPSENEQVMEEFVKRHSDMHIVKSNVTFESGRVDWSKDKNNEELKLSQRLFPHKINGEGHFLCVLKKDEGESYYRFSKVKQIVSKEFDKWQKDTLNIKITPNIKWGDNLNVIETNIPSLDKLKVLRCGVHLGECVKGRFVPSHSLAMCLKPSEVKNVLSLKSKSKECYDYFMGNTVECDFNGWGLVCIDGISCGWCKGDGSLAKNHYPKGLRRDLRIKD